MDPKAVSNESDKSKAPSYAKTERCIYPLPALATFRTSDHHSYMKQLVITEPSLSPKPKSETSSTPRYDLDNLFP